ncbi:6-phosphogluconate dehydrogenase (decarboxylating) [Brevibacterium sanguinis]|uniref:6-phosphogluconate dehydrogenase, decarboxylating n=2 Tax=Brevibacterium TaxID=1696 RepID=A0A366IR29_9MICO|nr:MULTISPECIES: NADP-dependent phosphogluconate dehydrogenase [Brevibacterium]RBP68153.1 6-phosphogluconate dehydrogenase (decarboxylating) [Brevibacterium sanguinis]RBP74430.1 6-phosphogluconate dehydrogenase (decarboxylating) [Brevibacterium celere]
MTADVGVIGTGVMGSNLARNLASQPGTRVAIYDRDVERARAVAAAHPEAEFLVADSPAQLASMLHGPRVAILMVNAGRATDSAISDLVAVFESGDIIVDGGNSLFTDTIARGRAVERSGIEFAGVGISGGEVGALTGPSMMVGGSEAAWRRLRPILEPIAAKAEMKSEGGSETGTARGSGDARSEDVPKPSPEEALQSSSAREPETAGEPCIAHVGTDGAGHFVKMIHNGIEYADMQLIAEAYALLREGAGLAPGEIAEVFAQWNEGELESYLVEVTAEVLAHTDPLTGRPFVDVVADSAGAKGTGAWTVKTGLDLGAPIATIAEAVFARSLSAATLLRSAGDTLDGPRPAASAEESEAWVETVRKALFAGKILAYVQGLHEIAVGAREHGWDTDLGEVARIWRAGCIIRARFLDRIADAYAADPQLSSLLTAPYFRDSLNGTQSSLREVVVAAAGAGVPVPALSSALAYYDGIRAPRSSAALVQGQRDFFGSHTYGRVDRPGTFHTLWSGDRSEVEV